MAIHAANTYWKEKKWEPESWQKGTGLNVVGKVVGLRFHSITSNVDVHRYNVSCIFLLHVCIFPIFLTFLRLIFTYIINKVIVVDVEAAQKRQFNKYQEETTPVISKGATGPNILSVDQLAAILSGTRGLPVCIFFVF